MVKKRTIAKTVAVTFGAAMTTMFSAADLNAQVVGVGFIPGSLAWGPGVSTNVLMTNTSNASIIGTFSQWNDSVGKTLNFNSPGLASWAIVSASSILSTAGFAGIAGNIGFTTGASGSVYVGFRSLAGNVGWFGMTLGGVGGPITWGPGQYGSSGESVHVSGGVPEPASAGLAMLALGAIGLRRRRRKVA